MELATDLLILGTWLGAMIFVGRYALTRWYRTDAGQNVMAFMLVVLIATSLAVVAIFQEDAAWRPLARLICWALIFSVVAWRVVILFATQRAARRTVGGRVQNDIHGT